MSLAEIARPDITVHGGRIIRPGFFRAADESGARYAASLKEKPKDDNCRFCPGEIERNARIVDEFGSRACGLFVVVDAEPPYAHWDGQRVLSHRMIIPERHVEDDIELTDDELLTRFRYVRHLRETEPDNVYQTYTRDSRSPSKSIPHLHTHLLELDPDPIIDFSFNATDGVTSLTFAELTPEQRADIIRSRTDS